LQSSGGVEAVDNTNDDNNIIISTKATTAA
jgi:hypothetical protein